MANLTFFGADGRRHRIKRRKDHGPFYIRFDRNGRTFRHSLGTTIESAAIEKAKAKIKAAVDGDDETLRNSKRKSDYSFLSAVGEAYVANYGTDARRRKVARGNVGSLAKIVRLGANMSLETARANLLDDGIVRRYEEAELGRIERDSNGNMRKESELRVRTTIGSTVTQARAIFKPKTMHWYAGLSLPNLEKFRKQGVTRPNRPKPRPLDYGVIAAMQGDAPRLAESDPAVFAAFLLFSQCGLRNIEIENARRSWLRTREDGVHEIGIILRPEEEFDPKGKTEGWVPMSREIYEQLIRISALDEKGFLIPAKHATERHEIVNGRICEWASKWIKQRSKVIYELRRYAGSLYYDQIGDIVMVQQFLRHSDLATTMKWYWYRLKPLEPLQTPVWLRNFAGRPDLRVVA